MSAKVLLDKVEALLLKKYNADVDRSDDFLEADLPKALPKEKSANGKYGVMLTIRIMIDGRGQVLPPHILEEELKESMQLKGGIDRTSDYQNHDDVVKLMNRLRQDIKNL
jgi:hypothetical protein